MRDLMFNAHLKSYFGYFTTAGWPFKRLENIPEISSLKPNKGKVGLKSQGLDLFRLRGSDSRATG